MERKLGLYVMLGDDGNLKRTLVSVSGETELEAATLNDEVILFSELIFDFYAFIVDRIRLAFPYLTTQASEGNAVVDMRVFEFIQDTVQDLIEEFEIDNAMHMDELPLTRKNHLTIYAAMRGIGGDDSWGAKVHSQYELDGEKEYSLKFRISLKTR